MRSKARWIMIILLIHSAKSMSFCLYLLYREWTDSTVAISTWITLRQLQCQLHHVGRDQWWIQDDRSRWSSQKMGRTKKQTKHELRQTQPSTSLLLRQEHHDKSARETLCVQVWFCRSCPGHAARTGRPQCLPVSVRFVISTRVSPHKQTEFCWDTYPINQRGWTFWITWFLLVISERKYLPQWSRDTSARSCAITHRHLLHIRDTDILIRELGQFFSWTEKSAMENLLYMMKFYWTKLFLCTCTLSF